LNEDVAHKVGIALGNFLKDAKTIVVARDNRKSGIPMKKNLIDGLRKAGKNIIDIGMVPAPVFYFAIAHYNYDGGAIFTGSHNPKEYNGIKVQKERALPIFKENGLFDIRDIIIDGKLETVSSKTNVEVKDVIEDYVNYVAGKTKLKRKLKIILDVGNASCGLIPEKVFKKLGCEVKTLFAEDDDDFPNHLPDPHETKNLEELRKKVVEEKADVGFAFDGDGDRLGVIDERGRTILGDKILMLLSRKALAIKKGSVVVEVRCPKALLNDITEHGGKPLIAKAGHAYVLDEVFRNKAVFGGELTGHMYFPLEYYDYDDAIFMAAKMAEIVSERKSLAEYVDTLPQVFASPEFFIEVPDEEKFNMVKSTQDFLRENNYDFLDIDGARINFEHGWALLRASNTTPFIKCRYEADKEEYLDEIKNKFYDILMKNNLDPKKAEFINK